MIYLESLFFSPLFLIAFSFFDISAGGRPHGFAKKKKKATTEQRVGPVSACEPGPIWL